MTTCLPMDTIDIELDHIFTTWIELWVPVPVLWVYNAGSNKIKLNGYSQNNAICNHLSLCKTTGKDHIDMDHMSLQTALNQWKTFSEQMLCWSRIN